MAIHKCDHLWKIDHLCAPTEFHFLPVGESYIHALSKTLSA